MMCSLLCDELNVRIGLLRYAHQDAMTDRLDLDAASRFGCEETPRSQRL